MVHSKYVPNMKVQLISISLVLEMEERFFVRLTQYLHEESSEWKKEKIIFMCRQKNIIERFFYLSSCIPEPGQKEVCEGLSCSLKLPERRCRQVRVGLFS